MEIDFTPITNAKTYPADKEKLAKTGSKQARTVWTLIIMIFIPIFWPVLAFKIIRFLRKNKVEGPARQAAMKDFADKNGYTFQHYFGRAIKFGEVETTKHKPNLPFTAEHIVPSEEIKGTILGCTFVYLMGAVFVDVASSSTDSQYPHNIMTINLPVRLPKVFINSTRNNLKGLDASPTNFIAAERHELEGDFPNYYTVKIEKNEQIDMYTTLTPEVMDTLKRNDGYDVWINEGQLVLMTFGDTEARFFAAIPEIFNNAIVLMREIDKIARSLR